MPSPPEAPRAAAVVVAGGAGRRFGGGVRKQYLALAGKPVLLHALRPFLAHPRIGQTVVVLPPEDAADPPPWLRALAVDVAPGGDARGDSVLAGLRRVTASFSTVLVHDGARPLVTAKVIERVLDACAGGAGAVAAVAPADTVQEVDGEGWILRVPERAALRLAQTPQGFPRAALLGAYERARADGFAATDDAGVFLRAGGRVRTVEGDARNLKVTRPGDLLLAEALLRGDAA
jgi:2-C-methyl-D-erythritol 4-phosphate cytidylyltransferase